MLVSRKHSQIIYFKWSHFTDKLSDQLLVTKNFLKTVSIPDFREQNMKMHIVQFWKKLLRKEQAAPVESEDEQGNFNELAFHSRYKITD